MDYDSLKTQNTPIVDINDEQLLNNEVSDDVFTTDVNAVKNDKPFDTAYAAYKADRTASNLSKVVKSLNPTINYALSVNNAYGDPLLTSKAKLITAKAIKGYDPSYNVGLPTYVTTQLRKLTRVAREAKQAIKIPERFVYENQMLKEAEANLTNNLSREPTLDELSDDTGLSVKQITSIRKKANLRQTSEGNFFNNVASDSDGDSKSSVDQQEGETANFRDEALRYLYQDLDYASKKILESMTGYGGNKIEGDINVIAKKVKLSPSQVYRISNKLADRFIDIENDLTTVYTKL